MRRKELRQYVESLPDRLTEVEGDHPYLAVPRAPIRAWRSRRFVVQLFDFADEGAKRLTVQRVLDNDGICRQLGIRHRPQPPLSWDELMEVKAEAGYGEAWAVELYPPPDRVLNTHPMRHLWLLDEAPAFGWKRDDQSESETGRQGSARAAGREPDQTLQKAQGNHSCLPSPNLRKSTVMQEERRASRD